MITLDKRPSTLLPLQYQKRLDQYLVGEFIPPEVCGYTKGAVYPGEGRVCTQGGCIINDTQAKMACGYGWEVKPYNNGTYQDLSSVWCYNNPPTILPELVRC